MTMHMAHPSLSMQGKKRGKQKFRNAEEARKSRELDASWEELQKKWGVEAEERKRKRAMSAEPLQYSLSAPAGRTTSNNIKSLDTGHSGAVSSKPIPQYTGTKMLGVGTMHKSNAVPIFSDEDAKQISSMRR
jgi:hypothetical protein